MKPRYSIYVNDIIYHDFETYFNALTCCIYRISNDWYNSLVEIRDNKTEAIVFQYNSEPFHIIADVPGILEKTY